MPEVISKYPEVTLQVLKEAGLRCGDGAPQRILTQCPKEKFCLAPAGEVCVYGLDEIGQATQISARDLAEASEQQPLAPSDVAGKPSLPLALDLSLIIFTAGVCLIVGFVIGRIFTAKR